MINPEAAKVALGIFKGLHVPDMVGQPLLGDVCKPWVYDFVNAVFGNRKDGKQLIREYFMLTPKKSGKSSVSAGVMLTACLLHERQNDELLLLSATKETANTVFSIISGMVRADPDLRDIFWVRDHIKQVTNRITNNTIKVVALANDTLAGKRAPYVLVDELWLLGKIPNAESIMAEATGGLASRPEGWLITLSTQSDEPPEGIFRAKLEYARNVRDGVIEDPSFKPIIYELPEGFNWRKNIKKAFELTNPNLGASVTIDYLLSQYKKVEHATDGSLQRFMSKHANLEIGMNFRSNSWTGARFWGQNEIELTLDELITQSEVITMGGDGGGLDDTLGLAAVGRKPDGTFLSWAHAWISESGAALPGRDLTKYQDLAKLGELTIVPKVGQDTAEFAQMVAKVHASGKLWRIGLDAHGLGTLVEALDSVNIPKDIRIGIPQGWQLSSVIQGLEVLLAGGKLKVAKQELMRYAVTSAKVEARGSNILITKAASNRGKIDSLSATLDAIALMLQNPPAQGPRKLIFFSLP